MTVAVVGGVGSTSFTIPLDQSSQFISLRVTSANGLGVRPDDSIGDR